MDARRGDFYVGLFQRQPADGTSDRASHLLEDGRLLKGDELAPFFSSRLPQSAAATAVVRDRDQAALALRQSLSSLFQWQVVAGTLVEAIARLAFHNCGSGVIRASSRLDALYIRRSDAELNLKA